MMISSVFLNPFSVMTMAAQFPGMYESFYVVILNLHPHRSGSTKRPGSARLHWNHAGSGLEEAQGQDLHLQASVCLCRRPPGRNRAACYCNHLHSERLDSWHALHRHPRGRTRTEKKCSSHRNHIHRWGFLTFCLLLQHDNIVLFVGVWRDCCENDHD